MLKKKIVLGMLSTTMVSLLSVAPVHAVTGNTDVTYKAGTSGPVDPIDPQNPENDPNNWIVYYPKTVTLNDNNKIEKGKYQSEKTKGKQLQFKVKQSIQGTDGNDDVNEHNVGRGIKVKASAENDVWDASSSDIKMKNSNSIAQNVIMGIGNDTALINKGDDLLTLTHNSNDQKAYGVLTNTAGAKDGLDYTTKLTFTFEKQN